MKPGTNTFLIGDSGTGKTHSIRTLIECGITPFIISTEPGIASILGDLPPEKVHWHYIPPVTTSWGDMKASANKINTMSLDSLTKMGGADKAKYRQFMEVYDTCGNFTCDRDGKEYGDVSLWNNDRALVLDSLSGLSLMAMNLVIGSKPTASPGDWGIAMKHLEGFLTKLITDRQCWYVLIAHLEREVDEISGTTQIMASTLGKKLAPKLPMFFDDVIRTMREGKEFSWSTTAQGTMLTTRNLPWGDKLPPTFRTIFDKWLREGGEIIPTPMCAEDSLGELVDSGAATVN